MQSFQKPQENRVKNPATTPPSTPQGPESNDQLVSAEYRKGPYPGDRPEQDTGEGSGVATHHTGIPGAGRKADDDGTHGGEGGPVLDPAGRDPRKEEGRERNEP